MAIGDGQLIDAEGIVGPEAPSDIQVVGLLSAEAAGRIDLSADCRTVRMHLEVIAHIRERRTVRDLSFVLENLSAAVERPKMIGRELRDYRRIRLVYVPERDSRWLNVCLKFVPAEAAKSKQDELWVSTGHPIPGAVSRLRNRGTAWHILG